MPSKVQSSSSRLDTPRSAVSISTDSSGRDSLRSSHPKKQSEPPTPVSLPTGCLTRKRAASLNTETSHLPPRIGDLVLNSASSNGPPTSDLTREQVCLCQPDPKIPRPRNAFILYRQHYQAQVVAQNPGLANPDISKIIGEQWRDQPSEVKDDWKRLAEEEKQRHHRQYPGYRYQPRRSGKPYGVTPVSASSTDDQVRCPKCNGRYISTPSTPLTPFPSFERNSFPGLNQRSERLPSFTSISRPTTLEKQTSRMDSPRLVPPPHQQAYRRPGYQRPQPLHTHRERDEDVFMGTSSPEKRRRLNNDRFNNNNDPAFTRGYSSSSPVSSSQAFPRNGPPMSASSYRQQQLPTPGVIVRQGSLGLPPSQSPMIQSNTRYPYPNPTRPNTFDESLRLPPLQTQVGKPIEQRDSQALGVEAMIMSIHPMGKINILRTIAPPLRAPGIASPSPEIRGAVVAIEGADKILLGEIGDFITEYLNKDSSCSVKIWNTTSKPRTRSTFSPADTEMIDVGTSSSKLTTSPDGLAHDPFVDYLSIISNWHSKSQEIAKYIITPPTPPAHLPMDPVTASNSVEPKNPRPKILPIALIPKGFSLTASDEFARRIAINDGYSPVDHWQWTATLWRGIIGPDVTVYTARAERSEIEHYGSVQVSRENWSIFLRLPENGKMDEITARRLGFEVLEMAIKVGERQRRILERRSGSSA